MTAQQRRLEIMHMIEESSKPISASMLARHFGVSRQIVVGDVALLRAQGRGVLATARGYVPESVRYGRYTGALVCRHKSEDTVKELYAIVDMGGEVLDVVVEHRLYGELTGLLNLSSRRDVDNFVRRTAESGAKLLSELTGGVHMHTVCCADEAAFLAIKRSLNELGFLFPEQ